MGLDELTAALAKENIKPKNFEEGEPVGFISSGDFIIDYLTSGGIPKGRVIEIIGKEGSGKTTLALTICGQIQKQEGKAALYVDAEKCMDQNNLYYAEALGVDTSSDLFLLCQNEYDDDVSNILHKAEETWPKNNIGIIVIDSVAGVMPKSWRGDDGKKKGADKYKGQIGDRAAFWSQHVPFLVTAAAKMGIPVILINQFRTKLDFSFGGGGVDDKDPMGGKAVKYFKSLSIALTDSGKDKERINHELTGELVDDVHGVKVRVDIIKNRLGAPHRRGYTYIKYGKGFDNFETAFKMLKHKGVIELSGQSYSVKDLEGKEIALGRGEKSW